MEKYIGIFTQIFGVDENTAKGLKYQGVESWDSVGHMSLMAEIEEAFGISMETDDIIDFSSFDEGIKILKKYGVKLQ